MDKQKRIFLGFLICVFTFVEIGLGYSQNNDTGNKKNKTFAERLFIGGGLGLSLGTYSSLIDVSPTVGYAITDDFVAGIGLTYKFYRLKDYYYNTLDKIYYDSRTNIYGGSVWARYFLTKTEIPVLENIFLHAEVEPLTFVSEYRYQPGGNFADPYGNGFVKDNERINLTGVFLGGGLRQPIGGRSYMFIELLWNFNEDLYSPYSNPRIMIGAAIGL